MWRNFSEIGLARNRAAASQMRANVSERDSLLFSASATMRETPSARASMAGSEWRHGETSFLESKSPIRVAISGSSSRRRPQGIHNPMPNFFHQTHTMELY